MGLTIQYSFQLDTCSVTKARRLVAELRQRALNLSFVEVYEQIELSGEACNFGHYGLSDIRRWLAIQASRSILLPGRDDIVYRVTPNQMIAFDLNVGEGCESANFGLCCYPGLVNVYDPALKRKRRIRTKLSGWSWSASCKTQYASNSKRGGTDNFPKCHLMLVELLDHAKSLGILADVHDESGYWKERDVRSLAQQV